MSLEHVSCYNCGCERYEFYDTENGYTLVRCAECALLYVNPRPHADEISQAMRTGMHRGDETLDVVGRGFNRKKVARYLSILSDIYAGSLSDPECRGRWLDIGCGYGEFMSALRTYAGDNLSIVGSEPIPAKIEQARAKGLEVSFIDLETHSDRYEYVSLLNVWSHLPDPVETIGRWKALLTPRGELLLESGHSSHLSRRDHHKPYYLPDHLSFANREIIVDVLERLGFEIVSTHLYRHTVFPDMNPMAIMRELARIGLRRSTVRNLFPRQPDRDLYIRARLKDGA